VGLDLEEGTKSRLVADGVEADCSSDLTTLPPDADAYRREGVFRACTGVPADEVYLGLPPLTELQRKRYRIVAGCNLVTPNLAAQVHGLRLRGETRSGSAAYTPVRFVPMETISTIDRMCWRLTHSFLRTSWGHPDRWRYHSWSRVYDRQSAARNSL